MKRSVLVRLFIFQLMPAGCNATVCTVHPKTLLLWLIMIIKLEKVVNISAKILLNI